MEGRKLNKHCISVVVLSAALSGCQTDNSESSDNTISTGAVAGSTAALTYQNGHLVVLDADRILAYRFPDEGLAELTGSYSVQGAETVFPEGESTLYIGRNGGASILNLDGNGEFSLLGEANHIVSCDPVIVDSGVMYLTLRSANNCANPNGADELQVWEVSDPAEPTMLSTLAMPNPFGLSKNDDALWICTGNGLARVNVTDSTNPVLETTYPEILCNDIIIRSEAEAYVTSDDAIYLIDLSGTSPTILSDITPGE